MNLHVLILLALITCASDALAQDVTFAGTVSRHELSDVSLAVSGTVHIRFGFPNAAGPDSDVLVPFTIPAQQRSAVYSKTVPWSLAGSVDQSGSHDFFTIEVSCFTNCRAANLTEQIGHYDESGNTVLGYSSYAERFGEGERRGGYTVNLILLPSFGAITGRFSLPNGKRAERDIELFAVALDYGFCCYANWLQVIQQRVVIKAGDRAVNFRFLIDESELAYRRNDRMAIGYSCRSEACVEHGLVERAWLRSNLTSLSSNDAQTEYIETALTSADTFSIQLPSTINLLALEQVSIAVPRIVSNNVEPGLIQGRLIVEKLESFITCGYSPALPIDWNQNLDSFLCFDGFPDIRTIVVSETPFSIPPERQSVDVIVNVEPMIQKTTNEEYVDHQRIRFECNSGCDSNQYAKQGYFSGFGNRFAAPSEASALRFRQTATFYDDRIVLSLKKRPVLPHLYQLLLQ